MSTNVTLPKWLTREAKGAFIINPDLAYPHILKRLGVKDADVDQYWLEVAYQCAKLTVQQLITGSDLDPAPKPIVMVIQGGEGFKDRWAHRNHPPGKGQHAATKGLEAKAHFSRLGGALGFTRDLKKALGLAT